MASTILDFMPFFAEFKGTLASHNKNPIPFSMGRIFSSFQNQSFPVVLCLPGMIQPFVFKTFTEYPGNKRHPHD